jgi:hypothetical protein
MFVWALVFTFAAACFKKPALIWICALLSFSMGFSTLLTVIQAGNRRLGLLIFSGNRAFTLYMAFVSLPFFITLKRGALLLSREAGKAKSLPEILKQITGPAAVLKLIAPRLILPAAAAAALALSVYFLARSPAPLSGQRILEDGPGSALMPGLNSLP